MKSTLSPLVLAACLVVGAAPSGAENRAVPGPPASALEARLATGTAAGARLHRRESLRLFYGLRQQRPAWSDGGGLSPRIEVLLAALRSANREGLRPAEYHVAAIDALLERLRTHDPRTVSGADLGGGDVVVDLDLLLTDAFLLYAAHLTTGRVRPESVEAEWNIAGRGRDLVSLLAAALEHDHLAETIDGLPPVREDYRLLRDALVSQRAIAAAGGWPLVPAGPTLREGNLGVRVEALRRRLAASGDLPSGGDASAELFDAPLAAALRRFQARHGLDADAVAGQRTLQALNTPALRRAEQIEANLERLRWLPRDLGPRRLSVNVADFRLELVEPGLPPLELRVIVGRQLRRTPLFTGEITSILFNPDWTVPERLAVEDKLPLILADPSYLEDNDFRVFERAGTGWREIDPATVDWTRLSASHFPYRLRQRPGPGNALGRVKFQFPNRHDIYLHDTPSRELFSRSERTFSSGCIRVERAVDLAERLLAPDPAWTRPGIEATIAAGATVKVPLLEPLSIYLLYWTAWVDRNGELQLREDVYGRDDALLEALARPLEARQAGN